MQWFFILWFLYIYLFVFVLMCGGLVVRNVIIHIYWVFTFTHGFVFYPYNINTNTHTAYTTYKHQFYIIFFFQVFNSRKLQLEKEKKMRIAFECVFCFASFPSTSFSKGWHQRRENMAFAELNKTAWNIILWMTVKSTNKQKNVFVHNV